MKLLTAFQGDAPLVLTAIQNADGPATVERGLHRLKGSARTIGADDLVGLLERVETDHAAGRAVAFDAIDNELSRCLNEIAEFLQAESTTGF